MGHQIVSFLRRVPNSPAKWFQELNQNFTKKKSPIYLIPLNRRIRQKPREDLLSVRQESHRSERLTVFA